MSKFQEYLNKYPKVRVGLEIVGAITVVIIIVEIIKSFF